MLTYSQTPTGNATLGTLDHWCQHTEGCVASWWRSESVLSTHTRARLLVQPGDKFPVGMQGVACLSADLPVAPCPANGSVAPLADLFVEPLSEFGNELARGLPYLSWLSACGLLPATRACMGVAPFYAPFSRGHSTLTLKNCVANDRFGKFAWGGSSARRAVTPSPLHDGIWLGMKTGKYISQGGSRTEIAGEPSTRWLPPPLHATYRAQPLAAFHMGPSRAPLSRGRVFVSNSDPLKLSLAQLDVIFGALLGCGLQVVYTGADFLHPDHHTEDLKWADARYAAALTSGRLVLLPRVSETKRPARRPNERKVQTALGRRLNLVDQLAPKNKQKVTRLKDAAQAARRDQGMSKTKKLKIADGAVQASGSIQSVSAAMQRVEELTREMRAAGKRGEYAQALALQQQRDALRARMPPPAGEDGAAAKVRGGGVAAEVAEVGEVDLGPAAAERKAREARNVLLLRAAARAKCFVGPRGGSSYVGFYQPGLHVVSDEHGRERCWPSVCAEARRRGRWPSDEPCGGVMATGKWKTQQMRFGKGVGGSYSQWFTRLPGDSGDSLIVNTGEDPEKLAAALRLMCSSEACLFGRK